jgi:hypothetical protein
MVEVQNIRKDEQPPEAAHWVLIEKTSSGVFTARGSAFASRNAIRFFRQSRYATFTAAVAAASAWAENNEVPVVYVRDIP